MINLERMNNLMSSSEFSSGKTSDNFHRHLEGEIQRLTRPGDKVPPLPPFNAAGSWQTKWAIYEQLRERENRPPDPAVIAANQEAANIDRDWNGYLQCRMKILEYVCRDEITEDAAQYLGLKLGDLGSPTTDDPELRNRGVFRRLDWLEVAGRIERAWSKWESMSDSEKRSIPVAMKVLRAERETDQLKKRIAALEASIDQTNKVA